jgi:hypothetical protein
MNCNLESVWLFVYGWVEVRYVRLHSLYVNESSRVLV